MDFFLSIFLVTNRLFFLSSLSDHDGGSLFGLYIYIFSRWMDTGTFFSFFRIRQGVGSALYTHWC